MLGVAVFAASCLLPGVGLFSAATPELVYLVVASRLRAGEIPYRDFDLEYPPGALLALGPPALASPASFDSAFKGLEAVFGVGVVVVTAICLGVAGASRRRLYLGTTFTALVPLALGWLALERYDLLPVLFTVGAIAFLLAGRTDLGFASLALGTVTKVYPVVVIPLALVYVHSRYGARAALRGAAVAAAVALLALAPFAALAPSGIKYPFVWQADRGLQLESIGASLLLVFDDAATVGWDGGAFAVTGRVAGAVADVQTLVQAVACAAVTLAFALTSRTRVQFLAASALTIASAAFLGKILSPQYLLWLGPIVPLVFGRGGLVAGALYAGSLLATRLLYEWQMPDLTRAEPTAAAVLAVRNAFLLGVIAALVASFRAVARSR